MLDNLQFIYGENFGLNLPGIIKLVKPLCVATPKTSSYGQNSMFPILLNNLCLRYGRSAAFWQQSL